MQSDATMKVLVTGGTGFVGGHAAAEIIRAGHEVRLLVRRPEQVARTFGPLAVEPPVDVVPGDVTDAASVTKALEGCEAVVHAAAVFSVDPRQRATIEATNVAATRLVLGTALERGLDPIVHISSYGALLPVSSGRIDPDTPPGEGVGTYSRSKAESERLVRALQERGKPAVSVMPGSVWGPHDPYFGESSQTVVSYLKGTFRFVSADGFLPIVDVRDLAVGIAATLRPGLGPRRYLMAGTPVSSAQFTAALAEMTGTDRRRVAMPSNLIGATAALLRPVERFAPTRLPLTSEMISIGLQPIREVDDSRAIRELGFEPRPVEETIADTVRSLAAQGRIGAEAGRLGPSR